MVDRDGETVNYPLSPEDYTLRTLQEVPNTGDSDYVNEFPLLGKGGTSPQIESRCEPGVGVMDVPERKWVIGDTFLRRYYSLYDDDRGLVGFVRSQHPDEASQQQQPSPPAEEAPAVLGSASVAESSSAVVAPILVLNAFLPPCFRRKAKTQRDAHIHIIPSTSSDFL